ncbi:MAG: hypothetical protein HWN65_22390 [Candidatus Helarchaeota archaeon]|nr:hypothetical protein [Candidatus Helarchaeota archaeon]
MLKNVLIFWSHGNLLFSQAYGDLKNDPHLVSGFLSAVASFARELGEKEIRSIQMQPHKVFMSLRQDLCFTIFLDEDDDEMQGKLILESLINSFLALYGSKLDPTKPTDLSIFRPFGEVLDDLYIVKNVHELIESTNKILSIPEIQKRYEKKFGDISLTKCWQSLNFLVRNDAIVEVTKDYEIRYRKKGELLKGLGLKFKK